MQDNHFFPRNRLFWVYHGSGVTIIWLLQATSFVFMRSKEVLTFNLLASCFWVIGFTFAALLFRRLYQQYHWHAKSTTFQVFASFLVAIASATVITSFLFIIGGLFFTDQIFNPEFLENSGISKIKLTISFFTNNIFILTLILSGWFFIYTSVVSSRRSHDSELKNLQLENALKDAELTNLHNQLNPHFLFNALNNIRFLIHENSAKADELITALSELLRYSLNAHKRPQVALSEELDIVKRFLDISRIQFEKRLIFDIEISPDIMPFTLPPMTLQMLVENAIKHGVDQIMSSARIDIRGEKAGDTIVLTVSNSVPKKSSRTYGTKTGLANIRERLKLLYGNNASLDTQVDNDSFTARLTIPNE